MSNAIRPGEGRIRNHRADAGFIIPISVVVATIASLEPIQVFNLVTNLKRLKLIAEQSLDRNRFLHRFFFGPIPKVQAPHDFPTRGMGKVRKILQVLLIDDADLSEILHERCAIGHKLGVIRSAPADADQTVVGQVSVELDEGRVCCR